GRGQQHQRVQRLVGLGELLAQRLELGLELLVLDLQLGPAGLVGPGVLLGRALPQGLGPVQLGLQPAALPVQVEQLVHVQVDALDPDGRLDLVRVLPDESLVQHGYASASVSSTKDWSPGPRYKTLPAAPAGSPRITAP